MKLAEALLLRADIAARLNRLMERITQSAIVQQGDKPAEDPEKLLKEALGLASEFENLVVRINRTNIRAKLPDGRTIMEAVAARDRLKSQHGWVTFAVKSLSRDSSRYGTREIKWVPKLDAAKLQKQVEDFAKKIRELNAQIQQANWKHDIEE